MDKNTLAHTMWECKYHVVFAAEYRRQPAFLVPRVSALCGRHGTDEVYFLSGGLCESKYLLRRFAATLKAEVFSKPEARYAGALGAAILASEL